MFILCKEGYEYFDETKSEFVTAPAGTIRLEHSLKAIAEWEGTWKKSFLDTVEKTPDEFLSYIYCMCVDDESKEYISQLTMEDVNRIVEYMNDVRTATTIHEWKRSTRSRQTVTAELVYFWMTVYHIPFTCDEWNFHKLMTLIRICNIKTSSNDKLSQRDAAAIQREENERRRALFGTKG